MRNLVTIFLLIASTNIMAQSTLSYEQIPDPPEKYGPGNVVARMVDGLGYRYYWATEGLTTSDLDYKPSEDARSCYETLEHLHGLSEMVLNAALKKPNIRPAKPLDVTFKELRKGTLQNLQEASQLYQDMSADEVAVLEVVFQRGENSSGFPFWNMLNGPISDAIYHVGQVVTFRRSSGNPMNSKVNVFMGKTGE